MFPNINKHRDGSNALATEASLVRMDLGLVFPPTLANVPAPNQPPLDREQQWTSSLPSGQWHKGSGGKKGGHIYDDRCPDSVWVVRRVEVIISLRKVVVVVLWHHGGRGSRGARRGWKIRREVPEKKQPTIRGDRIWDKDRISYKR